MFKDMGKGHKYCVLNSVNHSTVIEYVYFITLFYFGAPMFLKN
jgi:hypothetical protein